MCNPVDELYIMCSRVSFSRVVGLNSILLFLISSWKLFGAMELLQKIISAKRGLDMLVLMNASWEYVK